MTHAPFQTGSEGAAGADVMIVLFFRTTFRFVFVFCFRGNFVGLFRRGGAGVVPVVNQFFIINLL